MRKQTADADEARRLALAKHAKDKAAADEKVNGDDTLTGKQKADKLHENVQATAAIAAAVGELRSEAREEMVKAYLQAETGKTVGVLMVAQQRAILAEEGIDLPGGLRATEVMSRFQEYLDAEAASVQPTTAQKAEILKRLRVKVDRRGRSTSSTTRRWRRSGGPRRRRW